MSGKVCNGKINFLVLLKGMLIPHEFVWRLVIGRGYQGNSGWGSVA